MATFDFIKAALLADGVPIRTVDKIIDAYLANPNVWKTFETFALKAAEKNKRIGAKAIMERVRWEMQIEYNQAEFKANNNYTAYWARIFALKHPQYGDFFETRKVKGLATA